MSTVLTLTKRNVKLYMRNRTAVFFSMLTVLIIIMLNFVFLRQMNVDSLLNIVSIKKEVATFLVSELTLAGIVFTSTVTVTLCVIGIMIEDEQTQRMIAFRVAPISRLELTLGYILASFVMGCMLSFITLAISQVYMVLIGGPLLSLTSLVKLIGIIIVNVFTNACMVFFLTTFVRTSSSFSSLNAIIGTLIGFVAGIYLPLGMLPNSVRHALNFFPGLYGASWMRQIYTNDILQEAFALSPPSTLAHYKAYMGITLTWGDTTVTPFYLLLILIGSGILFIALSALVLSKKKVTDR